MTTISEFLELKDINKPQQDIIRNLNVGALTTTDLTKRMKVNYAYVSMNLQALMERGILVKRRVSRKVFYSLNAVLQQKLRGGYNERENVPTE